MSGGGGGARDGLKPWEPSPGVSVPRPDELRAKLEGFRVDDTHVVVDFDYTLTRYTLPSGERGLSSHLLIQRYPGFGAHFAERSAELFNKYHPIEIDDRIGHDEKAAAMMTWWEGAHDIMIEAGVKREHLADLVSSPDIELRSGVHAFFRLAEGLGVPVHVFSAGVGDVIEQGLKRWGVTGKYAVVSNMMEFDVSGAVVRFPPPLIHTLCKCGSALRESSEWHTVEDRRSVLLIGDQPGDCTMSNGMDAERVVRVGFLNTPERRALFESKFDVVLDGKTEGLEFGTALLTFLSAAGGPKADA